MGQEENLKYLDLTKTQADFRTEISYEMANTSRLTTTERCSNKLPIAFYPGQGHRVTGLQKESQNMLKNFCGKEKRFFLEFFTLRVEILEMS